MLILLDASHHQPRIDFIAVKSAGAAGMIHKATQGRNFTDKRYEQRREYAHHVGLDYGAYHFGTGDDPTRQAQHFLTTVAGNGPRERLGLLALDVERNPSGTNMTQAQAETFVTVIHAATGRYPLLYGGSDYLGRFDFTSSVLAQCPLWWAQYTTRSKPSRIPTVWPIYTLWQYTGSGTWPGVTGQVDLNRFMGSPEDLTALFQP